jgi:hypothetical protein
VLIIGTKVVIFKDMLMIFEYELDKLHEFHNLANSLHPRIKIELRFSNGQIEFLNVNVSINNGHIKTDQVERGCFVFWSYIVINSPFLSCPLYVAGFPLYRLNIPVSVNGF